MMPAHARQVKIAAVQMVSENGDIVGNLSRASRHVHEAAGRGAQLIVLPEFMPTGYIFTKSIWHAAEPGGGPTERWMRETSRALGVWLGTSFLEAEGEHFFNTFLITNPGGDIDGRVRKQTPAAAEAYFTKGQAGPHVIETALGRIGVGICYENLLAYIPRLMTSQSVDLLLMPHSAPCPTVTLLFPGRAVAQYTERVRTLASYYATALGIPTVFVNKCGPWVTTIPFMPMFTQRSWFLGSSAIVDSDGTVKARLASEEAVAVAVVTLDPARKTGACPACRRRWIDGVPFAANQFRLLETMGGAWYRVSGERKRRAKETSGCAGRPDQPATS